MSINQTNMKTKLLFSIIAVFFLSIYSSFSQNIICGDTFTDPAGPNANYANSSDYTVTIYPTNVGDVVTVTFTAFDLEATWDGIYVYDGNSISAPQIASSNPVGNTAGPLSTPGAFWGTTIPGPFTSTSADGSLTFRFRSDPSVSRAGWISNVTCAPPPTCLKPTAMYIANITAAAATLGWTENNSATSWEVVVLPCGSPVPTINTVGTLTSTNPYPITGLTSLTCYNVYVRSNCSASDNSQWAGPISFTTSIAPPICGGNFTDPGGPNANYPDNSDSITTICPDSAGNVVTVTFSSYITQTSSDALYVFDGNSINAPQIASGNLAGTVPGGLAGGYWGTTIPGPFTSSSIDGCLTFRFRSSTATNYAGWIANVACAPPLSCPRPTSLIATNITTTSATLGWTNNSSATSWQVLALPSGSPAPTLSTTGWTPTTTNPFVLTGLVQGTCYTFYVRADCGSNDISEWSTGYNFCTLIEPPVCGGQFIDNGGINANYANSSDNTYTICPTTPGEIVTVVFNSFDTEATWDGIYVYDGNSISAPQIASTNPVGNAAGPLTIPGAFWGTTIPGPFTSSSPDGCLTIRFRSDPSVNRAGWVADVSCAPSPDKLLLVAFIDQNNNGVRDTGEILFPNGNFIYQQNNDGISVTGYSPSGQYSLFDSNPANTYDFSYEMPADFTSYFSAGTTAYNNINVPVGSGTQIFYFPITIIQSYSDVSVTIVPISSPRPNLGYVNRIVYRNLGIDTASGTLTFAKPGPVTITTVSQTGVVNNVSGFTYNFTNLLPNETRTIEVTMTVPGIPTVNVGNILTDTASVSGMANDLNSVNNTSSNSQIVVNSYDPNNKMESHGDKIPFNLFAPDDYFHYTIHFQNNGTASAIDVTVEDFLNTTMIDEETVLMESASHNYVMNRVGNHLVWIFKNIFLPTSSVNATGSMGYVEFKVKLKPGFQPGTIVPNNASIYFDANPAVVTNTFNVKFTTPLNTENFDAQSLVLYPNPANSIVQLNLTSSIEKITKVVLYDMIGKTVKTITTDPTDNLILDVSSYAKGVYMMEITSDNNSKLTKKLIIE